MQFCLFTLYSSLSKSISNFIVLLCTTITYWCSWIWTQVYLDSLEWKISLKLLKAFNQYFLENIFEFFSFTITETLIWNVTLRYIGLYFHEIYSLNWLILLGIHLVWLSCSYCFISDNNHLSFAFKLQTSQHLISDLLHLK